MNRTNLPPLPPLPLPGGELPLGDAGNRKRPLDELLPEPPAGLLPGGLPVGEPFRTTRDDPLPVGEPFRVTRDGPLPSGNHPPLVPG